MKSGHIHETARGGPTAILLVSCPDRKGLVAKISEFIFRHGGNILEADQHTDRETDVFLARFEWDLAGFGIAPQQILARFHPIADEFQMDFEIHLSNHIPKIALFVSKLLHCVEDLLLRWQAAEFMAEFSMIVSNHREAETIAQRFGIPFFHTPITEDNKETQEVAQISQLRSVGVELVVLARYMQVLSERFVYAYPNRVINIHHSFLPAFAGAHPYRQAYCRGVKLVGATAHYATMDLDEGPIIEQEVVRVTHRDSVQDMVRKGRDLEKVVLARALRLHLNHRVLPHGNKTVVFA